MEQLLEQYKQTRKDLIQVRESYKEILQELSNRRKEQMGRLTLITTLQND
ncbi:hypothetical protein [Paenibacillus arenosi]|uniref:Uncharacterized protein n=1 Tax=Paenibacillus arenosi TaxID=2774142 RepID=A0ABR9AUC3_9BACL|nr:hypothetical protein [Paenibacillus arenosi]MBD8497486.1 hypothetical protein [Paenibacillus arenosi]